MAKSFRLESGRTVAFDDSGNVMTWDRHGGADNIAALTEAEARDLHAQMRESHGADVHYEALAARTHPRFEEARDRLLHTRSRQELEEIDRDPELFLEQIGEAMEDVGESVPELEAAEAREDRRVELSRLLHSGRAGTSDLGELLDLGGLIPAEELPDEEE